MDSSCASSNPPRVESSPSNSPQKKRRKIEDLIKFIEKNEIKLFYNEFKTPTSSPIPGHITEEGRDELTHETFHELCNDLVEIIEQCIGPSEANIKDKIYMKFLTVILPKLVDILLKRKTSREHVGDIRRVLIATARLLAQPVSQEILQLCELRNHLLSASNSFKFFSPDGTYGDRSSMSGGFFAEYGQPEIVIMNHRYVYFWPWDYSRVVGGSKAVGHFLRVYHDSEWLDGRITKYDPAADLYELEIVFDDNNQGSNAENPPAVTSLTVDLKKNLHTWVDIANREKLPKCYSVSGKILTDSQQDVGQYIRVWWPLYHRDYYGKVLSYDPATGMHTIMYEDKDTRPVNMKEKDYEVILPIPESVLASVTGRSHSTAAMMVGAWHRNNVQQNSKYVETESPKESSLSSPGIFLRPDLSVGLPHTFSYHHADLVDTYFSEGGFSSLFQSLRDTSLPPPDALLIILHMKFLYALRQKIQKPIFENLIWDAKELIPMTILRFEESQIKNMTKSDLNIILSGLKDLVMLACPTNCNIQRDIDILHLSLAYKLLTCSQIQKRFLGLSILKEEIVSSMPLVSRYLPRQPLPIGSSNRPAAVQLANTPKKSNIGMEFLEQWILSNNIFDAIFLRSAHQDLIAKSEFLIIFLALRKSLQEDHVNAIWQSSIGGHEAVVRVIHQLILNVIPVLDPSLRNYLFNLISIIPFSDYSEQHLHLLKSFTVNSIKLIQKDESQNSQVAPVPAASSQVMETTPEENSGTPNGDEGVVGVGRRGQVINAPQRNWLGFAVLWQFIQDQSSSGTSNQQILHVDVSLVDLAVDHLVDLLKEEFKNDREVVIQRCVNNIRNGTSVPVSAKILRRTLTLYPTSSGGWFSNVARTGNKPITITILVERIHKQHNLIECFLEELEEYHNVFKDQARSQNKEKLSPMEINDFRIKSKGKMSRISHLHGMKERLKLLSVILCNSPISLQESHLSILWRVFVTESLSVEVTDVFIKWLESCLSLESKQFNTFLNIIIQEGDSSSQASKLEILRAESPQNGDFNSEKVVETEDDGEYPQSFGDGVLKQLLEGKLGPIAAASSSVFSQFCRKSLAIFVIKLFLYVNTTSNPKSMRLENDSSWYRSVTVEPVGLPFLWRLATDADDDAVSKAASYLLIELYQRMPQSKVREADAIRSLFLQYCFCQISVSINLLQQIDSPEDTIHPTVEVSILSLRVKRYVSLMKDFVQRFTHPPKQFSRVIVLSNRSQSKMFEVLVSLDEQIKVLKSNIGSRLQISLESLVLNRTKLNPANNELGPLEKLDRDDVSLRSLKFKPLEYVVVTRLENSEAEKPTNTKEGSIGKAKKEDVILSKHLTSSFIPPLNPFEWLGMEFDFHSDHLLHINEPITSLASPDSHERSKLFTMPKCPLLPHTDMVLQDNLNPSSSDQSTHKSEHIARLSEYLGPYLLKNPTQFDHLLQMLDGYLSLKSGDDQGGDASDNEISMALWEVVQSLPAHVSLLSQLRLLETSGDSFVYFRNLIDVTCPYRMLYTLQMIDSLSTSTGIDASETLIGGWKFDRPTLEWLWKLVSLGFPDFLLEIMKAVFAICQDIRGLNISSHVNTSAAVEEPRKPLGDMAVSRNDAYVLSLVLMLRILHKLLMLDDLFARWQIHSAVAENALFIGDVMSNHIPPGTILSLISVDSFVPMIMKTMLITLQRVLPSDFTSVSAAHSLVEHSMLIIFGLLQSVDDPIQILNSFPDFFRWIRACLLRVPAKEIRRGAARRILECLTLMLLKCRDAKEYPPQEINIRINFFHFFFLSVLKSTHPGFDGSLGGTKPIVLHEGVSLLTLSPSTQESYTFLGPENYRHGEELYNLVAGLLTLRSRPTVLNAIKIGSFEDICKSPNDLPPTISWTREEDLCSLFVEKLFTHRSLETFHSSVSDGTLIGILRTLIVLVHASNECQSFLGKIRFPSSLAGQQEPLAYIGLIQFLYFHCLFPQSSSSSNPSRISAAVGLCQTPTTRQLVYALLLNLCGTNKENLATLVEVLTLSNAPLSMNLPPQKVRRRLWEYDPSTLLKPSGASLGLVNQGATCYMNSFLQQLYHVKCFSNHLLEIDCDPSDSDNASVLFELQVLFGYLRFSQKNYCDTLNFCKVFKDYDGQPVRLGEQKDVNEFAAMLFEKLETNPACKSLLQQCFGGKLVWQIISTESTYRSEREEPFFMLTAEVKDKTSLEDSLELYVAGEMLSGDNKIEDSTGKKVDALRRCAIRTLPEILIIHLKRFEFDLETMNRLKINDFFSFPDELNMFPYTEQGIQQTEERRKARNETSDPIEGDEMTVADEYESNEVKESEQIGGSNPAGLTKVIEEVTDSRYRLKGIVAHTGAIDSGHYYSFIRDEGGNTWMEYNDSSVLCFEAESIPGECFGGPQKRPAGVAGTPTIKQYNAYILVYERIVDDRSGSNLQQSPRRRHDLAFKSECAPLSTQKEDSLNEMREIVNPETIELETPTSRDRSASMLVDCEDDLLKNGRIMALGGMAGPISTRVMQAVWSENTSFLVDRTKFSIEYILFYWKLLDLPLIPNLHQEVTTWAESNALEMKSDEHHPPLSVTILSHLSVACFDFCVEILSRARAQQCLPHFIEKLEDIVMHDLSGSSAESILKALARDPQVVSAPSAHHPASSSSPERDLSSDSHFSIDRAEDRDIISKVDQLLITIYVDCPHVFTTSVFSRLLMWCIKILRRKHCGSYLSVFPVPNGSLAADPGIDADASPVQIHRQNEVKMESCKQYSSCVTRFIGKLMMIIDYYQPEDLLEHRGNESLSDLLMRFACLGTEEKKVLINFGSIYRLVCSSIILFPVHRQYPTRDCLRNSIDLITVLIRTATLPTSSSSELVMSSYDSQAFTNRIFLENALLISPQAVTPALQHLCLMSGTREILKVLTSLMEKVGDCALSTGARTPGQAIKIYFVSLSEVILSLCSGEDSSGPPSLASKTPSPYELEVILQEIIPLIVSKTNQIASRHNKEDLEYIYLVTCFLYRVGIKSESGLKIVNSLKEHWKRFSVEMSVKQKTAPVDSTRRLQR